VLALHERLASRSPKSTIPGFYALDGSVAYLAAKTGANRTEDSESVAESQRPDAHS
jgi:hypothetical protein